MSSEKQASFAFVILLVEVMLLTRQLSAKGTPFFIKKVVDLCLTITPFSPYVVRSFGMVTGHVLTGSATSAEICTVCLQPFLKLTLASAVGSDGLSVLLPINQQQGCHWLCWSTYKPITKLCMKWFSFSSFQCK